MNNNELENIETIDLGENSAPNNTTVEPTISNVEVPVQPVENVSVTPEVSVATEASAPEVNPQANVLNQIQTDVINAESSAEAELPPVTSEKENPESIGTVTNENGETVEVVPVESKSVKDTFLPLILLAVGLLVFILLIPKLSEIFNGM